MGQKVYFWLVEVQKSKMIRHLGKHLQKAVIHMQVQTRLMLLCKIFSSTTLKEVHEWKFKSPSSSQCLDMLDCNCRKPSCYSVRSSVACAYTLDANYSVRSFLQRRSERFMGGSSKVQAVITA